MRRLLVVSGVVVALLLGLGFWWQRGAEFDPVTLTLGTGPQGGVYHSYGRGLEQVSAGSATEVVARPSAASVANIRQVHAGELDAGFTMVDVAALAVAGHAPFEAPQDVAAIARLYDNHTHVVVRADSRYTRVADLAGQPVSVGAADSGTEMVAERLLREAGVESGSGEVQRRQLDLEASAQALVEGRIEAFFWSGGIPTDAIATLARDHPIRLIDLSDQARSLASRYGQYFTEVPIPAGTYPRVDAVRTVAIPSLLIVNADMPEPVAHALTATLVEHRTDLAEIHPVALQLSPRSAISTLPVPLHPGAVRYYQEIKYGFDPP